MQRSALSAFALSAVAALAASGCLSPYIKAAPDTPAPKPSKVLLAGFTVHLDNGHEDKGLVGAVVDAAQNAGLDEFGKKATDRLKEVMAARGYDVTLDGARTKALDAIQLQSSAAAAALTGMWREPDASAWTPATVDSLFVKPKDVIPKLNPQGKEYFAFADVSILDEGMFLKEPHVVVRAVVYDQDAKKVLDLQGLGEGESTLFLSNRSPANLDKALAQAFDSIKAVKEEPIG